MKKQKHLTPMELNLLQKKQAEALTAAGKAMQIIALVILKEEFGFGPKRLGRFMDRFEDTLDYYNGSDDYQGLLQEWNEYFADYAGIRILPEKKGPKTP